MIKAEFSSSLLQFSVSHDPSEIILISWFAAHEWSFLLLIIIIVENNHTDSYFCANHYTLFQDSLMNMKFQTVFEIEIFCNINVFSVTSGQLNAFLLILFLLLCSHSILFSFNMASRVTSLCSTRLIFMTTGSGFMTWPQEVITGLKSSPSRGQISARPHLKTSLPVRISQSMFLKQWPLILFLVMLSTFGIINKYRWEIQCTNTY